MLLVRLLVSSRILVVKFWGVKSCMQIFDSVVGRGGSALLTLALFKDKLYIEKKADIISLPKLNFFCSDLTCN